MKPRISRFGVIVLAMGMVAVLAASLLFAYKAQAKGQERLRQDIAAAQKRLAGFAPRTLAAQALKLKGQVDLSRADIAETERRLGPPLESIDSSTWLYDEAAQAGVSIHQLSSPGRQAAKLGKVAFEVLPITVGVSGAVPDMVEFVLGVGRRFPTGVIGSVQMAVPESTGFQDGAKPKDPPSTTVQLKIYSYSNPNTEK